MRYLTTALAAALLAACGQPSATETAATPGAPAASNPAPTGPAAAVGSGLALKGEGSACKDLEQTKALVAAEASTDMTKAMELFGKGAEDGSCRNIPAGQSIKVTQSNPDGWACVDVLDSVNETTCYWVAPGRT